MIRSRKREKEPPSTFLAQRATNQPTNRFDHVQRGIKKNEDTDYATAAALSNRHDDIKVPTTDIRTHCGALSNDLNYTR